MKMYTIRILLTIVCLCQGQNLTHLIKKCNEDIARWEAEATKWYNNYVTYVVVSSLISFTSITATICYCQRPRITQVVRRYRDGA